MRKSTFLFVLLGLSFLLTVACTGGRHTTSDADSDTIVMKYAERLLMLRHADYTEVLLADPWNEGKVLHRYFLVNSAEQGEPLRGQGTVVVVPLRRSVIATSVHCGLLQDFGREDCLAGVCDLQYIHLPFVQDGVKKGSIKDCASAMAPSVETLIDLHPDAIFLSPFQNSGGYGRVEELGIPIIETADYMETSPLGRAEWMRFYGLLFGCEDVADSLFAEVEQNYHSLSARAFSADTRPTILMDKMTGSVWYTPGGNSTIGHIIADANITYPWADDTHSGSLSLPFETVLEKAGQADIWLFRYEGAANYGASDLLAEHRGYAPFAAFKSGKLYGCNTGVSTFFEDTPFHPELLLHDFITIAHPELQLGPSRYFLPLNQ